LAPCVAAEALAVLACALTLVATGATDVVALPGTPVPSAEAAWLVPVLRLVADAAATVAVGCLLGQSFGLQSTALVSGGCYTVDERWGGLRRRCRARRVRIS
jgi:hypothetical protein